MTIPEYIAWLEAGLKEAQRSHDLLGKANNNPVFSDNGKPWPSTGDNKNAAIIQVARMTPYAVADQMTVRFRIILQRTENAAQSAARLFAWANYNLGRGPKNLTGEMMAPNVDEGTQAYAIEWDVVLPMDNTISVVPVPGERQHWESVDVTVNV